MKINPVYYSKWIMDAYKKSSHVGVLDFPVFVRDLLGVLDEFVAAFVSLPISGKINILKLAKWAFSNPDPLEDVRNQMDLVRKKWNF